MLAKVFNKGQVVIPARLRKKYKINIGDRVNIIEERDGIKIVPVEVNTEVKALAGMFSKYAKVKKLTEEIINQATAEYLVGSAKDEVY